MPKDHIIGELGADCLGDGKIKSKINWVRIAPGQYETKPFRFLVDKIPESDGGVEHWRLTDCRVTALFFRDTGKACKLHAQSIIDIEQGRKPNPEPKKRRKPKITKYEGLYVMGERVDLETGEPIPEEPPEQRKGLFS